MRKAIAIFAIAALAACGGSSSTAPSPVVDSATRYNDSARYSIETPVDTTPAGKDRRDQ